MIPREEVFVFGSNQAGRHGKGAALYAALHYNAVYGEGFGRTGNAYAIPTKDRNLKTLPLPSISRSIGTFGAYARKHQECLFLLTPIGTGLAGYPREKILNLIRSHAVHTISNVVFTGTWFDATEVLDNQR